MEPNANEWLLEKLEVFLKIFAFQIISRAHKQTCTHAHAQTTQTHNKQEVLACTHKYNMCIVFVRACAHVCVRVPACVVPQCSINKNG